MNVYFRVTVDIAGSAFNVSPTTVGSVIYLINVLQRDGSEMMLLKIDV